MSTRQELFGNEHKHEPSEKGNRDCGRREMGASRRAFARFYDGFYASRTFGLRTEIALSEPKEHTPG